jgi:hypothetical protein
MATALKSMRARMSRHNARWRGNGSANLQHHSNAGYRESASSRARLHSKHLMRDEIQLTAARQFPDDGVRRYLVWVTHGTARIVHTYDATSADDGKAQARDELRRAEAALSSI